MFEGLTGNLGHDLGGFFNDAGKDFAKQPTWLKDLEIAAPAVIGAGLTLGADLPALGALGGLGDLFGGGGLAADTGAAVDLAATGGADAAATLGSTTGAALDIGSIAGDAALPATATLDAGTAPAGLFADFGGISGQTVAGGGLDAGLGAAGGGDIAGGAAIDTAGGSLGGAAGAAGGQGAGSLLSSIGGTLKSASPFLGAAGLGFNLFQGYEQKQQLNSLNKQQANNARQAANTAATENAAAAPLLTQGQTLMSYLTTGTLPPQFQAQLDQAIAAQKAGIIQGYAQRGMSTNPQQNSQLQQDLANIDMQAQSQKANMEQTLQTAGNQMVQTANQLLSSGLSATQLAAEIPIQMSQLNQQLNTSMIQAISGFAAAINGGRQNGSITSLG